MYLSLAFHSPVNFRSPLVLTVSVASCTVDATATADTAFAAPGAASLSPVARVGVGVHSGAPAAYVAFVPRVEVQAWTETGGGDLEVAASHSRQHLRLRSDSCYWRVKARFC